MTDDARRREELGKNGHDFDHVYCSEGTVGVKGYEMGGRGISSDEWHMIGKERGRHAHRFWTYDGRTSKLKLGHFPAHVPVLP